MTDLRTKGFKAGEDGRRREVPRISDLS